MDTKIGHIAKVEIKGLWNRFDLCWELHPDVNVLSGINGSGKSTVLDCLAGLLFGDLEETGKLVQRVDVVFDNNKGIFFENRTETLRNLEQKAQEDDELKSILSDIREKEGDNYRNIKSVSYGLLSFSDLEIKPKDLHEMIEVGVISIFDTPLQPHSSPDKQVRTTLDRTLFDLQKQYLDYQLNVGKRAFEALKQGQTSEDILRIEARKNRFLEIVDYLFEATGKKINRAKNELSVLSGEDELSVYQLSSGEKQMLLILLTLLVQDDKPAILFMDEPEISLHFDWQKKLLAYARELNPQAQLILATHSPAIIIEGWQDRVFDMRDLITKDLRKVEA